MVEVTAGKVPIRRQLFIKADRLMRRIVSGNYYSAKAYYWCKLAWTDARSTDRVLVYSLTKVGSSSVFKSLIRLPNLSAYHFHTLERKDNDVHRKKWRRRPKRMNIRLNVPRIQWDAQYVQRLLARPNNGRTWKIITLVRDPVARNISSFFDILYLSYGYDCMREVQAKGQEAVVRELVSKFQNEYRPSEDPDIWFDQEIKHLFGIDVYASRFPVEEGYQVYRSEKAALLLMRLEDLGRIGEKTIQEFLGIRNFRLLRFNQAKNKLYSQVYKPFRDAVHLSDAYLDQIYDSRYARHFYTHDERIAFRKKRTKAVPACQ